MQGMPDAPREKSAPQKAMERLGLRRDIDLVLHLPLRYEDETRIERIAALRDGDTAQVEGVVSERVSRLEAPLREILNVASVNGWGGSAMVRST